MSLSRLKQKYLGDRQFYRMVLAVAIPMMVQNGITTFVGLLDNIMVGQTTPEQMNGVAIVNQLMFVFNLCIFGGLSGAGIFTAQYFGNGDDEGIRHTFRFKIWLALCITGTAVTLFLLAGEPLIRLYLTNESDDPARIADTLYFGQEYLRVMLLGLPAFATVQIYTSTLRECSETLLPMKAGIAAVLINLTFNWLLIFGNLGFPKLGVIGAAVATVISRFTEAAIVIVWTHTHKKRCPWIEKMYRTLRVPAEKVRMIFAKGFPLLVNEALWSVGQALLVQCYSVRGLDVVNGLNISTTISNLFMIIFTTLGSSVAIIVGQLLGAGKLKEAKDTDTKMIVFSILCSMGTGLLMFLVCPLFPQMYNTTDTARQTAVSLMRVSACCMPFHAFMNAAYFTLRSGGKTWITFLFDCGFVWTVSIPIALILSRCTDLSAPWMMAMVGVGDLLKCTAGYIMVKRNTWINNMVAQDSLAEER